MLGFGFHDEEFKDERVVGHFDDVVFAEAGVGSESGFETDDQRGLHYVTVRKLSMTDPQ